MKIYHYAVPLEVEKAGIDAMIGRFSARDVTWAAMLAGAPEFVSCGPYAFQEEHCARRIADRLLQRQRKQGNIWYNGRFWEVSQSVKHEH